MPQSISVSDDEFSAWKKFPAIVQNDPCFSAFRDEIEGNLLAIYISIISNLLHFFAIFSAKVGEISVQNELLQPQVEKVLTKRATTKFDWMKPIIFVMIWAFAAWHLLTVKEKNLPKYDVLVHFNQPISKFNLNALFNCCH